MYQTTSGDSKRIGAKLFQMRWFGEVGGSRDIG